MKRFLIYFNGFLLLLIGYFSWSDNKDFIHTHFPEIYKIVAAVVILGNVFIYIFNNILQFLQDQKRLDAYQKTASLHAAAQKFIKDYGRFDMSLNVMIFLNKFWQRLEPLPNSQKNKLKILSKVFSVIWTHGDTLSSKFEIATTQGIYGEAFNDGHQTGMHFTIVSEETLENPAAKLNKNQISILKHFVFIGSCAIPNKKNELKSIGLLNIESKDPKLIRFLENPKNLKKLTKDIKTLAEIYKGFL